MALVGDNGAGKSTLIKCVAGTHTADSGEILFEGEEVHIHGPKDAARLGIEVVYQDLALCDNLDVVQNMYLGREEHDWFQRLNEPKMEQQTAETLKSLAVTTIRSIRQPVATLSGGQRQSVAVAQGGAVELEARDPRRADRRARRRADRAGARARQALAEQGSRSCSSPTTCTTSSRRRTGSPCSGSGATSVSTSARRRPRRRSSTRSRPACRRRSPAFPVRAGAST